MSEEEFPDIHLRVLYDFEYSVKDDRKIRIQEGEELYLIKKTNSDWWQVIRNSSERPFFVPAAYVKECSCSRSTSKEISQHGSIKRHQEIQAKSSVLSYDVKTKSSESLKYEKDTSTVNISCSHECKTSKGHGEKQPDTFQNVNKKSTGVDTLIKEDASHILLDKRKSWAVEELVAELSKMRTERSCYESSGTKADDEQFNDDSARSSSSHMSCSIIHSSVDDKNLCTSKHSLSTESDKADNFVQRSKRHSEVGTCVDVSETNSRSCLVPCEGSKSEERVIFIPSESLDKLVQETQCDPAGTVNSRAGQINFSGRLNEPSTVISSALDNTKMESTYRKVKNKLRYTSSFKTKKEMEHRGGNSVLSTSWENALFECEKTKDIKVIEDEKKLKKSQHVPGALKGQMDLDHYKQKLHHSGSDLEVSQKESSQHWNAGRQDMFGGKRKGISVVSGSESEENLDESIGLDEGSISGLSDDILYQSGTSKVYSDISDGAVSDDVLIESLGKSSIQLQKKRMPLLRKNRVESHDVHGHSSPPSPSPTHKPFRVLNEGWEEYKSARGRTYYYNHKTHDKSWKPPRRHQTFHESAQDGSIENLQFEISSPAGEVNGCSGTNCIPVPSGWREAYDEDSGELCYVNIDTGVKVCCKSLHVADCWKCCHTKGC